MATRSIDRPAARPEAVATAVTFTVGRAYAAADFSYQFAANVFPTDLLNIRLRQALS